MTAVYKMVRIRIAYCCYLRHNSVIIILVKKILASVVNMIHHFSITWKITQILSYFRMRLEPRFFVCHLPFLRILCFWSPFFLKLSFALILSPCFCRNDLDFLTFFFRLVAPSSVSLGRLRSLPFELRSLTLPVDSSSPLFSFAVFVFMVVRWGLTDCMTSYTLGSVPRGVSSWMLITCLSGCSSCGEGVEESNGTESVKYTTRN